MELYLRCSRVDEAELEAMCEEGVGYRSRFNAARDWIWQQGCALVTGSTLALLPPAKVIEAIELAEAGDSRCLEVAAQVRDEICEKFCNAIRHRYEMRYQENHK